MGVTLGGGATLFIVGMTGGVLMVFTLGGGRWERRGSSLSGVVACVKIFLMLEILHGKDGSVC